MRKWLDLGVLENLRCGALKGGTFLVLYGSGEVESWTIDLCDVGEDYSQNSLESAEDCLVALSRHEKQGSFGMLGRADDETGGKYISMEVELSAPFDGLPQIRARESPVSASQVTPLSQHFSSPMPYSSLSPPHASKTKLLGAFRTSEYRVTLTTAFRPSNASQVILSTIPQALSPAPQCQPALFSQKSFTTEETTLVLQTPSTLEGMDWEPREDPMLD